MANKHKVKFLFMIYKYIIKKTLSVGNGKGKSACFNNSSVFINCVNKKNYRKLEN